MTTTVAIRLANSILLFLDYVVGCNLTQNRGEELAILIEELNLFIQEGIRSSELVEVLWKKFDPDGTNFLELDLDDDYFWDGENNEDKIVFFTDTMVIKIDRELNIWQTARKKDGRLDKTKSEKLFSV